MGLWSSGLKLYFCVCLPVFDEDEDKSYYTATWVIIQVSMISCFLT
ncbi:hypothetical protein BDGGKGIB_01669 [Nodularia sphaerocarpa UHCC 0038]|nr:hypothetical protein BDGGKGIB_01669 [Nodularia sphaerocarpa UHCC 0038]